MEDSSGPIVSGKQSGAYALRYSSQIGETENNTLKIDEQGNVVGNIQYSQMGSSPRALGWFHQELSHKDPDLATIGRLIWEKNLIDGKIYSQPPAFGMYSKFFIFKAEGKEIIHHLNAEEPTPEGLSDVEDIIEHLFQRLEESPLRTLSLNIAVNPSSIAPNGELRINFKFKNDGKFPSEFRNPAHFLPGGPDTIRINLWKKGTDEKGKETNEFVIAFELAGREYLVDNWKAVPSDKPILRLEPRETTEMWTTLRIPMLQPDQYIAEAIYYSSPFTEAEIEQWPYLTTGEYHADTVQLSILKK
jgi:hypothetical protein